MEHCSFSNRDTSSILSFSYCRTMKSYFNAYPFTLKHRSNFTVYIQYEVYWVLARQAFDVTFHFRMRPTRTLWSPRENLSTTCPNPPVSPPLSLYRFTFFCRLHTRTQMMASRGLPAASLAASLLLVAVASAVGVDERHSPHNVWGAEHEGRHLWTLNSCSRDDSWDFYSSVSATAPLSTEIW